MLGALPLVAAGHLSPNGQSVWGYFVHDEPKGRDFPGLASSNSPHLFLGSIPAQNRDCNYVRDVQSS